MESRFVRVAGISDIDVGKMQKVTVGDRAVLIANVNGNYYALTACVLILAVNFRTACWKVTLLHVLFIRQDLM